MVPAGAVRGPSAPDDHSRLPPGRCRVAESSVDRIRGRRAGRGRGNRRRLRAGALAPPEKAGRPARFTVGGAAVLPAISLPVLLPRLYGRAVAASRPVRAAGNAGAATRACGAHRSDARRFGTECVSTCVSRWFPEHKITHTINTKYT